MNNSKLVGHIRMWLVISLFWFSGSLADAAPQLPTDPQQWLNSRPLSLDALKGKGVIMYFFEEGCPRCREKWPGLLETAAKFKAQPVFFIGVNSGNKRSSVESYARGVNLSWPIIVDEDRSIEKEFDVGTISLNNIYQMLIITPDGRVTRGNPANFEGSVDAALQGAAWKVDPTDLAPELKQLWMAVEMGEYAKVGAVIGRALASRQENIKAGAEKINTVVQSEIQSLADEARSQAEQGQKWAAYKTYQRLNAVYAGFPLPDEIKSHQKELESDDAVALEVKALKNLETARAVGKRGSNSSVRRAVAILKKLVDEMPDTEAAATAKEIIAKVEGE